MGIRESLKEPQPENLKNFAMPEDEPSEELDFDFEEAITENIINQARTTLQRYRKEGKQHMDYLVSFTELAGRIRMLGLEKLFDIQPTDDEQELIINDCIKYSSDIFCFFFRALNIKFYIPDKLEQLPINNVQQKIIRGGLEYWKKAKDNSTLFSILRDMKIISPEQINYFLDEEEDLPRLKKFIKELKERKDWKGLVEYSTIYKLLFPEKFVLSDLKKYWKMILEEVKEREKSYFNDLYNPLEDYLSFLLNLKILLSEKVKITDHGLELIMPEKKYHLTSTPPRPERRNF